jgi:hypothetical protein
MRRLLLPILLGLVALVANVASASGAPTDPFQWKSFVAGVPNASRLADNHATGNVLILEGSTIRQLDENGQPANFAATGTNTLSLGLGADQIFVDNSGGPTQGYIYATELHCCGGEQYEVFTPGGVSFGLKYPLEEGTVNAFVEAGALAPDGQFWVFYGGTTARPLAPDGTALGPPQALAPPPEGWSPTVFDGLGNWYAPNANNNYEKFEPPATNFAKVGPTGLPWFVQEGFSQLSGQPVIDPSDNDLFARQRRRIIGIHTTGALPQTPFELLREPISGDDGGYSFDATGQTLYVGEPEFQRISIFHREPPSAPYALQPATVDEIRSSKVELHTGLIEGGSPTTYHFEYGTDTNYGMSTAGIKAPEGFYPITFKEELQGLQPSTTYHVRLVATNGVSTTYGIDRTFKTFAVPGAAVEASCPNSLARKQTGALRLPDCRAYELVSAKDTAGYEVESYLAPGQTPFGGYPDAPERVLYSTHSGAIPGPWNATNNGIDPYIATRTENGWITTYEGLPANINLVTPSFSSSLGEADSALDTLAFAGPNLCNPCFTGGALATGIPVRLPGGQVVQGMAGSLDPGVASARPEGKIAKYFSSNGRYLIFLSKYAFEPGANDNGSDLTVYERDLAAGTTRIVSLDGAGATLTGAGISELAVSDDGSRVLIGKRVSVDSAGNEYVHPYLFIAGRQGSVDLDPGATAGVLFAGMSEDGSKTYFTTTDKLLPQDEDPSADLYEATADPSGQPTISLLSGGGAASCNPVPNTGRTHWNSVGAVANCDPVAVGGGGGVSADGSTVYFLSPEQLDGSKGTANQPNLYRVENAGAPVYVVTLEPDNPLVVDSVSAAGTRHTGDFQTTTSGNFATFVSAQPLSGVHTFNRLQVFRYATSGGLVCASCDYSETDDDSLASDAALAPNGLSILEDGRVFFGTRQQLVLNDANRRVDVYQYSDPGAQQLISSGSGPFDSGLLTASADGTDVFFFVHEELAPEEDEAGSLMKIYDAREEGGFFKLPTSVPCKASDECHGPGTVAPGPPVIQSSGTTTPGNFVTCRKNQVKRHGRCVAKAKKKHHKKHANKHVKKAKGKGGKKHA